MSVTASPGRDEHWGYKGRVGPRPERANEE
jgi:hypothetical protein